MPSFLSLSVPLPPRVNLPKQEMDARALAMMRAQAIDLGNARAQHIRNVQDEHQAPVDAHALAASRRSNRQGTAESEWANELESTNALSAWNSFGATASPSVDADDGTLGQSHRMRLQENLRPSRGRGVVSVSPASRGGRAGRGGRGGGAAGRHSDRLAMMEAAQRQAGAITLAPEQIAQRNRELSLEESLSLGGREGAGRRQRAGGAATSSSRARVSGGRATAQAALPARGPVPTPVLVNSSSFLERFMVASGHGRPGSNQEPAQRLRPETSVVPAAEVAADVPELSSASVVSPSSVVLSPPVARSPPVVRSPSVVRSSSVVHSPPVVSSPFVVSEAPSSPLPATRRTPQPLAPGLVGAQRSRRVGQPSRPTSAIAQVAASLRLTQTSLREVIQQSNRVTTASPTVRLPATDPRVAISRSNVDGQAPAAQVVAQSVLSAAPTRSSSPFGLAASIHRPSGEAPNQAAEVLSAEPSPPKSPAKKVDKGKGKAKGKGKGKAKSAEARVPPGMNWLMGDKAESAKTDNASAAASTSQATPSRSVERRPAAAPAATTPLSTPQQADDGVDNLVDSLRQLTLTGPPTHQALPHINEQQGIDTQQPAQAAPRRARQTLAASMWAVEDPQQPEASSSSSRPAQATEINAHAQAGTFGPSRRSHAESSRPEASVQRLEPARPTQGRWSGTSGSSGSGRHITRRQYDQPGAGYPYVVDDLMRREHSEARVVNSLFREPGSQGDSSEESSA